MSDAAVATIVSGFVTVTTMVVGFLTLWVKLRYGTQMAETAAAKAAVVEGKLDDNTNLTRAGTAAAASNAKAAEQAATEAKSTAETISKKLNGGIESTIEAAIAPIRAAFIEHAASDERNMAEIRAAMNRFVTDEKLSELIEYVHKRNHDILDAVGAQSNRLDVVLLKLEGKK